MREKREAAQRAAEARRREAQARARARAAAEEVIAPLRELGFRADEARQAAALCESIPEASLEQRVRRALTYFHPPGRAAAPAAN
jgi:Holliday junction resolvasome RuvABC DNA-binding subunit